MKGVSLDISVSRTGVAYWLDGNLTGTDDASFKVQVAETHLETYLWTLKSWRAWLKGELQLQQFNWVAIEDAVPLSIYTREYFYGMKGILGELAVTNDTRLYVYSATHIKKIFTGNGKASKAEVWARANQLYEHFEIENHDQADAVAVGWTHLNENSTDR